MDERFTFDQIHGNKYDLSVRWPSTIQDGSIFLRNFETFTCYVWNGEGWYESTNDRFIEVGGSTGEIYDTFTLEEARAIRPEAFR